MAAPRTPLSAAAASALLLVSLTALAGCGGDDSPEPDAEPSSEAAGTPSESPSPAVTEASEEDVEDVEDADVEEAFPMPKPPKAADTPAARKAFTEFVVERWGYALVTNEADAVTGLSPKGSACKGCKDLEQELQKRRKEGWNVDFPGAKVKKVTVEPADPPRTFDSVATIDIPESRSYFEDGTFRNDNQAFRNAEFAVQMRRADGKYLLLSFTVG
jgi:hypothetical protein